MVNIELHKKVDFNFIQVDKLYFSFAFVVSVVFILIGLSGEDVFSLLVVVRLFLVGFDKKRLISFFSVFFILLFIKIISDYYNLVSSVSILRDSLRIFSIFIYGLFVYFIIAEQRYRYLIYCFFFLVLLGCLREALESYVSYQNFWRHGVGEVVSILLVVFAVSISRWWLSLLIIVVISYINYVLDFRTMILLSFLSYVYYCFLRYLTAKPSVRMYIVLSGAFLLIVMFFAYSGYDVSDRAGTSNYVRQLMLEEAWNDLLNFNWLGNGYASFQNNFLLPRLGNEDLEASLDGTLPMHGYLWHFSYEGGVLFFLFYIFILILQIRRLLKGVELGPIFYVLSIYFILGSFVLAVADFDRFVIGVGMGVVFYGYSVRRHV